MNLVGRRAECEALDLLLASALAGTSRALVLRGHAGSGKTALLDYLAERVTASGSRLAGAVGVESEMRARLQRPASALCADARSTRAVARSAGRGPRNGLRVGRGPAARPVPGGARHVDLVRRSGRAAAAHVHRRRCAVARPGISPDPRLRRSPPARRAGGARVRRQDGYRRRRAGRPPRAVRRPTRRARCPGPAAGEPDRPARCGRLRPDRRREPRQPARPPRAPASLDGGGARRWLRPTREPCAGRKDRGELPAAPAPAPFGHAAPRPRRVRRTAGRPGPAPLGRQEPRDRHGGGRRGRGRRVAHGGAAGGVRTSPRAVLDLSVRGRPRSSPCASRARRGHRRRDRPRPTGLAPRPRHPRTRRGGRHRARAIGQPRAGSRRHRGHGRLPAAGRRAHRRPGATPGASARRGGCELPGRRLRHSPGARIAGGGVQDRRAPARTSCPAPRSRRAGARLRRRRCPAAPARSETTRTVGQSSSLAART